MFAEFLNFKRNMKNDQKLCILRHDVDSPFTYKKGFFKKMINRIYLSKPELPGREIFPGYLEALRYMLKLESKYNAKGTFFFRTVTCPTRKMVKTLNDLGHEMAFHADRIETFEEFQEDLTLLQNKTGERIYGFTKHGYAKVRSGGPWDENKMIEFARKAKLKYLAQGEDHPGWIKPQLVDQVHVFGHHMTIKDTRVDDIFRYLESHEWPILMIHPEDLFIKGVEEKFIEILKAVKAIPVLEALELIS